MAYNRIVHDVLSGQSLYEEAVMNFKKKLRGYLDEQDIRRAQQTRVSLRLLHRWQQLQNSEIRINDFLSAVRDYVLLNGRLLVPRTITQMVANAGLEFGLFIDADHYVNATLSFPEWLPESGKKFVEIAYGRIDAEIQKPSLSAGDAYISQLTSFNSYRSYEQKIAVHTALTLPAGYTMLLSLPTGGGKSLVTQLLAAVQTKLTLVVVPTVALALDQERAAKEILQGTLPSDCIGSYHGDQDPQQTSKIVSNIRSGKMRFLVISPEAVLKNKLLNDALQKAAVNKNLGSIVMDEAHMIPDWGAQFRPEFQLLAVFRRKLMELSGEEVRTFLLSATLANENVNALKMLYSNESKWIELRSDALRSEPRYCFLNCSSNENRKAIVIELCRLMPKPLLVYVLSPFDAKYWVKVLKQQGFNNIRSFTGETGDLERSDVIKAWNKDIIDIVVATSAFGMGVDKPDVRTIIHACIPESLNRFYQEVGRGGRDGWPSLSILCVNPKGDEGVSTQLINGDSKAASSLVPRVMKSENMVGRWFSMKDSESSQHEGDIIMLDSSVPPVYFTEQQQELSGKQNMRWNLNVLLFLHRYGYIEIQEIAYNAINDCYFVTVKLNDIYIMNNQTKLLTKLEIDRENELEAVRDGFNHMKRLVRNPERFCWGGRFVKLYPYAYESCGGCPTHDNQVFRSSSYKLDKKITYYDLSSPPKYALMELMGNFKDMLISRSESGPFNKDEMKRLALMLNQCGIKAWVMPDNCEIDTCDFKGLVLKNSEFIYTIEQHPSLLSNGIFASFDDLDVNNQAVYAKAASLQKKGIRIVYYAKASMFLQQEVRTIANVINGYIRDVNFVLQGG